MNQKLADLINVTFGMRKFIAWIVLFLVGVVFRIHGDIDGGQFVDLVKATFLGFVAGNGVEHMVSVAKEYIKSNGQAQVSTPISGGDDLVEPDGTTNIPVKEN
jgi:hypothetical protein